MQIASFVKDEVQEMFDRIDEDGDRSISFEEFAGLMLEMDHAKLNSELRACFDFIDSDHDGRVSFDEFCQWVTR
jgi:Ca2+-binding EF-hand superfamily protein